VAMHASITRWTMTISGRSTVEDAGSFIGDRKRLPVRFEANAKRNTPKNKQKSLQAALQAGFGTTLLDIRLPSETEADLLHAVDLFWRMRKLFIPLYFIFTWIWEKTVWMPPII